MIEIREEIDSDNETLCWVQAVENGIVIHEESFNCGYGASHENAGEAHRLMGEWLGKNRPWQTLKVLSGNVVLINPADDEESE